MAVRMNVLVLRPPGNGSKAHHQFDDVIGQLLGRPGLDVTLLERLPQPDDSTTERLALESLGGHIACLAWDDAESVVADLANAGKPMARRPHQRDPDVNAKTDGADAGSVPATTNASGRMFFFDMRKTGANVSIFADLQALLQTLQTPMFQIGGGSASVASSPSSVQASENTPLQPDIATISATIVPTASTPIPTNTVDLSINDEGDLDRLVDELDDLDL